MSTLLIILSIVGVLVIYFIFMVFWYKKKMKNYNPADKNENVIELTDSNFNHQTKEGVVLVDFWAAWCMPCRMQGPIIDDLASEISEKAKIAKMDIDANQKIAQMLNIRSIPTLVLFKNGKEIKRFVGVKQKSVLLSAIKENL